MRLENKDLLTTDGVRATVSLATSQNFNPVSLNSIVNCGIQAVFTGTPNGTFNLQVSNDLGYQNSGAANSPTEAEQFSQISNWTTVANSDFVVVAAGNIFYDYQNGGAKWARVIYTAAGAGSGTPTVTIMRANCKGV